jgi:hypothetical protein
MTTTEAPGQSLSERLGRVRAAWPGGPWEWDDRMGCALSTLTKAQEAQAKEALAAGLPSVWLTGTLAEAPQALQRVCERVGGLRSDQQVFSAALDGGALVYCLWWPWGGGANISARIGATSGDLTAVVRSALGVK